jgi:hypothetical protein
MPRPRKSIGKTTGISMAQPTSLAELIEIMGGIS